MILESDGHPILVAVSWNGDVSVVQRLFRASQVDVELHHNRRAVTT